MHSFILASASKDRTKILTAIGFKHTVVPSKYNEEACTEQLPAKRAEVLAIAKAKEVHAEHQTAYIIGCDTIVESSTGALFEKPKNEAEVRNMIAAYSNSYCLVHSGLSIVTPDGKIVSGVHTTTINFSNITSKMADFWVLSEGWQYSSGGLLIERVASVIINSIEGEYTSVQGFPIRLFAQKMQELDLGIIDYI
jgi:septum formation protein